MEQSETFRLFHARYKAGMLPLHKRGTRENVAGNFPVFGAGKLTTELF